jgi:hypothetical protein
MVRSEGNMSLKNPVTPQGIDPGTVRLLVQAPMANDSTWKIIKQILVLMNSPQMIRHRERLLRSSWFTSASRTAVQICRPTCEQSAHWMYHLL